MLIKITTNNDVLVEAVNENTLLITWQEKVCAIQHQQILTVQQILQAKLKTKLLDSVAAFNSLQLKYNFQQQPLAQLLSFIEQALSNALAENSSLTAVGHANRLIEIPVYYGEEAGWDLAWLSKATSLSITEIIKLHTSKRYRAYALGFTPGFCYLASIDSALIQPRKSTPRTKVPRGAVAIADEQTAVYPDASPGGWHIIGQTAEPMYQITDEGIITKISVGDEVKFTAISKEQFLASGGQINATS